MHKGRLQRVPSVIRDLNALGQPPMPWKNRRLDLQLAPDHRGQTYHARTQQYRTARFRSATTASVVNGPRRLAASSTVVGATLIVPVRAEQGSVAGVIVPREVVGAVTASEKVAPHGTSAKLRVIVVNVVNREPKHVDRAGRDRGIDAVDGVLSESAPAGYGLDRTEVYSARQSAGNQVVVVVPRSDEQLVFETCGFV